MIHPSRGNNICLISCLKLNQNMLINLYYSLIYSHIVYCIQAWGNAGETELNQISILQKGAVRLITDNQIRSNTPGNLQSSDPLLLKLNILKIKDIHLLQISHFIFNCVNSNIITNFPLNCHTRDYRTRSNYTDVNILSHSNNLHILSAPTSFYGLININKSLWAKILEYGPKPFRSIVSLKYFAKVMKHCEFYHDYYNIRMLNIESKGKLKRPFGLLYITRWKIIISTSFFE